eukprot:s1005_g26.t1
MPSPPAAGEEAQRRSHVKCMSHESHTKTTLRRRHGDDATTVQRQCDDDATTARRACDDDATTARNGYDGNGDEDNDFTTS